MSEQYYRLCLDDYSNPTFTSFGKYYFGTLNMISKFITALKKDTETTAVFHTIISAYEEYIAGNKKATHIVAHQEVPFLIPAKSLGEDFSYLQNYAWEHLNTWNWIYDLKCEKAESHHIWLSCKGEYTRCIRTRFSNLQYKNISDSYTQLGSCVCGHPHIIESNALCLQNRLFIIEKHFEDKEELIADIKNFKESKDVNFSMVLDDVFGDG